MVPDDNYISRHPVLRNVATNANIVYTGKHTQMCVHKDRIGFSILLSYITTKSADVTNPSDPCLIQQIEVQLLYCCVSIYIGRYLCIGNTPRFKANVMKLENNPYQYFNELQETICVIIC